MRKRVKHNEEEIEKATLFVTQKAAESQRGQIFLGDGELWWRDKKLVNFDIVKCVSKFGPTLG